MSIYEKLAQVQRALKAPKNLRNDYAGFNYRSAANILSSVKLLLADNQALIILTDEVVNIGNGNYVKATARFFDLEDGSFIDTSAYAKEDETRKGMCSAQITGSSSSYARKYALCGILAIDDSSSDPDTGYHGSTQSRQALVKIVKSAGKRAGINTDAWLSSCNRTWETVSESELSMMLQTIKQRETEVA